ncbi:xanthine dehydrogenase family protein subunit M [Lutibacter sp. B2]|nr:xanthine dehydrogenase family protein subunit M [Lutibacter sp. B2]
MKNFEYFKPSTLKEASELLIKKGANAHILNGGTDLIIRMKEGITSPDVVVDIKGIKELHNIKFDEKEGLFVGACVVLNDMAHNQIVKEKYKVLSNAAKSVGSGQIRNKATMTGNICNASPLADTSTPLLALDAKVLVYGPNGEREIPINELFVWVRKVSLEHGEIVKGVRIPAYENIIGDFQKISRRKEVDLSTVASTVVKINDEIRIALASVAPTPIRARKAESFIKGKKLTDEVIEEAAKIAASEASPIEDVRASKEYRIEMIKIAVKRNLNAVRS